MGFPRNNRINYDNSEFVALMREEIKALSPVTKVVVPKEMLAVAVHVRRGGGWDRPLIQEDTLVTGEAWEASSAYDVLHVDLEYPERFAPDTYFIKQLRYVLDLYPDTKMYVHILLTILHPI